jgi:hypothetical protein
MDVCKLGSITKIILSGGHYYALFFKDLEGIKYEIVYEGRD